MLRATEITDAVYDGLMDPLSPQGLTPISYHCAQYLHPKSHMLMEFMTQAWPSGIEEINTALSSSQIVQALSHTFGSAHYVGNKQVWLLTNSEDRQILLEYVSTINEVGIYTSAKDVSELLALLNDLLTTTHLGKLY